MRSHLEIVKYLIEDMKMDPCKSHNIYNSYDSKYSNYSFKLRSCKEDFNGYYYLTIYNKKINID